MPFLKNLKKTYFIVFILISILIFCSCKSDKREASAKGEGNDNKNDNNYVFSSIPENESDKIQTQLVEQAFSAKDLIQTH